MRGGSDIEAPDVGYHKHDGKGMWDFDVLVNPPGINSGDPYHFGSEEKRDLFDKTRHLPPVVDFNPALGWR